MLSTTCLSRSFLRFYVHEDQRHHGHLVWEWLLEQANSLGVRGGSAFRAMAGFGRHHMLHEARFFELTGLTVEVEFIVTDEEADRLLELLGKRGARLGGRTGQYLLRFVGKDGFVASGDVVACLRDAGLDIAESPTSKKDLRKIQDQFNAWAKETGLPYVHISRICAMSIGENYDAETLRSRGGM